MTFAPHAEGADDRKMARTLLARRVVDDLLRAGPVATRQALRDDFTLASFLSPAEFARLADYAKPPEVPARRIQPGGDGLSAIAPWHRRAGISRAAKTVLRCLVFSILVAAIVWLSLEGILHVAQ